MEKFKAETAGIQIEKILYRVEDFSFFFIEDGELVVWRAKGKKRFFFCEEANDYVTLMEIKDEGRWCFFDKKTHDVITWTPKKGRKFRAFKKSYNSGSHVEIWYRGKHGFFDKVTHQEV